MRDVDPWRVAIGRDELRFDAVAVTRETRAAVGALAVVSDRVRLAAAHCADPHVRVALRDLAAHEIADEPAEPPTRSLAARESRRP